MLTSSLHNIEFPAWRAGHISPQGAADAPFYFRNAFISRDYDDISPAFISCAIICRVLCYISILPTLTALHVPCTPNN